jgi:hypothetical protein
MTRIVTLVVKYLARANVSGEILAGLLLGPGFLQSGFFGARVENSRTAFFPFDDPRFHSSGATGPDPRPQSRRPKPSRRHGRTTWTHGFPSLASHRDIDSERSLVGQRKYCAIWVWLKVMGSLLVRHQTCWLDFSPVPGWCETIEVQETPAVQDGSGGVKRADERWLRLLTGAMRCDREGGFAGSAKRMRRSACERDTTGFKKTGPAKLRRPRGRSKWSAIAFR